MLLDLGNSIFAKILLHIFLIHFILLFLLPLVLIPLSKAKLKLVLIPILILYAFFFSIFSCIFSMYVGDLLLVAISHVRDDFKYQIEDFTYNSKIDERFYLGIENNDYLVLDEDYVSGTGFVRKEIYRIKKCVEKIKSFNENIFLKVTNESKIIICSINKNKIEEMEIKRDFTDYYVYENGKVIFYDENKEIVFDKNGKSILNHFVSLDFNDNILLGYNENEKKLILIYEFKVKKYPLKFKPELGCISKKSIYLFHKKRLYKYLTQYKLPKKIKKEFNEQPIKLASLATKNILVILFKDKMITYYGRLPRYHYVYPSGRETEVYSTGKGTPDFGSLIITCDLEYVVITVGTLNKTNNSKCGILIHYD